MLGADPANGEGPPSNGRLMGSERYPPSDGGGGGGGGMGLTLDGGDDDDVDDDDDMPATLERLGGAGGERQRHDSNSGGVPAKSSVRPNQAGAVSSDSPIGDSQRQRQHQHQRPPNLSLETPVPLMLSEGALSTPAVDIKEAVLERGKGKIEAPWLVDDNRDGEAGGSGGGGLGLRLEQEPDEDDVSAYGLG